MNSERFCKAIMEIEKMCPGVEWVIPLVPTGETLKVTPHFWLEARVFNDKPRALVKGIDAEEAISLGANAHNQTKIIRPGERHPYEP